jgi:formylglycine-generating enzyme required for sulfatase activity
VRFALVLSLVLIPFACVSAGDDDKKPTGDKEKVLKRFVDEFVTLTPGEGKFPASFTMGSDDSAAEKPVREVKMKGTFSLGQHEVTQELYEAVMGKDPSKWKGPRNSVEMVNWNEAVEFCAKATEELRKRKLIGADEVIRLPTEVEWEYACRAGTKTRFSFGDKEEDLKDHAWYNGNAKGNDPPVGKKKPNPWGLYDMHGYVWEWCSDANGSDDKERILRGGSWADGPESCRSAYRYHKPVGTRSDSIGFRCVRARAKD